MKRGTNPIESFKVDASAAEVRLWGPDFMLAMTEQLDAQAWRLADRYRVDADFLRESLADDEGVVRIRATTAPLPRLLFHPDPATLVERILGEGAPKQRAQLQLGRMSLALWGLGLRWGCPLQDYPRDAHHAPEDIPWGLVDWMESDARALQHLRISGMRLREKTRLRFKRDCLAGQRLGWLVEAVEPPRLPVGWGPLKPPTWDVRLPDRQTA